ncbi:hypothetical protein LguiA_020921 [Lonicera macranthoides]
MNKKWTPNSNPSPSPTNITHIAFGVLGSSNTWGNKKWYIESWWNPNVTRGFLFLDKVPIEHLPWPQTSPRVRISEDTSRFKDYNRHRTPFAIRLLYGVKEIFRAENRGVRWYVLADDDTIIFIDNLVTVLSRYDHEKYFYIGSNAECVVSNSGYSFEMAFGGAGYALSYPLAEALATNLDVCIKRYPFLFGSDHMLQACVADLGVSLTHEKGFHQIDLRGDISGFLSSHPQSPILSLHHVDAVDPIFPSLNRYESVNHVMKAAKADESLLLQQSVCFFKQYNWTFSISWGYSAHIYESIIPPSFLQRPIETFAQWRKGAWPPYMFNVRPHSNNPCEAPHIFFFDSVDQEPIGNYFVTKYIRKSARGLSACSLSGNHSADYISTIRVLSRIKRNGGVGRRRDCCDVVGVPDMNATAIKLRACMSEEIVA